MFKMKKKIQKLVNSKGNTWVKERVGGKIFASCSSGKESVIQNVQEGTHSTVKMKQSD